jgi:DNA-nicking Smr family endonuclease
MQRKSKFVANRSLSQLADLVSRAGIRLKSDNEAPGAPVKGAENPDSNPLNALSESTDEEIFIEAMQGVDRACWRHNRHCSPKPAPAIARDSDLESRKLMKAILEGDFPIAILDHPEYIEGWIGVAGKRFLPKLRNGMYSIQGQIDLHGLTRTEARSAVEDFIVHMSRFRSCCIKIIHGRGINSPAGRATLKESLQRLLKTRRMSRYVVAYASAPSRDGGMGAVYVLLRRQ